MFEKELEAMILAGKSASKEVMRIYSTGFNVSKKNDASPVTDADLASNKILSKILSQFNEIAWLSEEDADDMTRLNNDLVFIVDPLDGTTDFVNHDDSFGINIALTYKKHPVCSVVMIPAQNTYAYALKGKGTFFVASDGTETKLHVSDRTQDLIFLVSKTHREPKEDLLLNQNLDSIKEIIPMGASTKAVYLASGKADCSIRFTTQTKEWDICAPELIVTEAGGLFVDTLKHSFEYNRIDVYNKNGYCMFNRQENMRFLA